MLAPKMSIRRCVTTGHVFVRNASNITERYPDNIEELDRKAYYDNDVTAAHRAQWLRKHEGMDWPYRTPTETSKSSELDPFAYELEKPRHVPRKVSSVIDGVMRKFAGGASQSFRSDNRQVKNQGAFAWKSTSRRSLRQLGSNNDTNSGLDNVTGDSDKQRSQTIAVGRTVATLVPPPSGSAEYPVEDGSVFCVRSPPSQTPIWQVPRVVTAPPRWIHEAVVNHTPIEEAQQILLSKNPSTQHDSHASKSTLAHSPFSNIIESMTQVEFPQGFVPQTASEHLIHAINARQNVPLAQPFNMNSKTSKEELKAQDLHRNRRAWISARKERKLVHLVNNENMSVGNAAKTFNVPESLVRLVAYNEGSEADIPQAANIKQYRKTESHKQKASLGQSNRALEAEPLSDFKRILYAERKRRRALW